MTHDQRGQAVTTQTPAINQVIERNIHNMSRLREQAANERGAQGRLADLITTFSGRMIFVYIHVVWFGFWILANEGLLGVPRFDPFPYGLLTLVVSLEAIFLSAFVLISQNRISEIAETRAELDLHIGLLTEHELTRVLQMLDAIQAKLGIVDDKKSDLADLEVETKPEDVLAEIDRLRKARRKAGQGEN